MEKSWDDFMAEGRRRKRWLRFRRRLDDLLHPVRTREWNAYLATIRPMPEEMKAEWLSTMRIGCENSKRVAYRDRRIRRRLPPLSGVKLFQPVYVGSRQGSFAIIQRHWPHHYTPVWSITRRGLIRVCPRLRGRYLKNFLKEEA